MNNTLTCNIASSQFLSTTQIIETPPWIVPHTAQHSHTYIASQHSRSQHYYTSFSASHRSLTYYYNHVSLFAQPNTYTYQVTALPHSPLHKLSQSTEHLRNTITPFTFKVDPSHNQQHSLIYTLPKTNHLAPTSFVFNFTSITFIQPFFLLSTLAQLFPRYHLLHVSLWRY